MAVVSEAGAGTNRKEREEKVCERTKEGRNERAVRAGGRIQSSGRIYFPKRRSEGWTGPPQ